MENMKTNSTSNVPSISSKTQSNTKRKNIVKDRSGRRRVSQACNACRSKKLKCDGIKPVCSSCCTTERDCVYGILTKKRGLPEGYVRGLERLLALFISEDGGGNLNMKFQRGLVDEITRLDLIQQWNGEMEDGETLAETWRNSQLCKAFETLLPELDAPDVRGPASKKPRLEPHAIGAENPRANNLHSPRCQDGYGKSSSNDRKLGEALQHQAGLTVDTKPTSYTPVQTDLAAAPIQQTSIANESSHALDSIQSTLSMPFNLSEVMDEFPLDLNFSNTMITDDTFFEMSNLDFFTGDRDETYRNLGFLLPQDGTATSTLPAQSQQSNQNPDQWLGR